MTTFTLNNGHTFMKKDNGYCYAIVNNTKTRIALPVFNANYKQFVKEENERQNAANEFTNIDPIVERKAHEQELEDALREAEQNLNRAVMGGDQGEIHQASNDLTKARAEWDNRNLDAAAENPEISVEQFVELVQEAEESANTEAGKEIIEELETEARMLEDYCRHPEGTDLQKPAVLNQYGCVDCSKCNVQNCVHRDCMRRNPTSEGGLAECPRLKVKAEEPKQPKAKKVRKSKDIAYEGHGVTLTAKQVDFIKHLPDTYFWENGVESVIWVDCLCDDIQGQFANKPMTVGAMISTLCEKGLGTRTTDRKGPRGGKATSFALTEMGQAVAIDLGL